MRLGLEWNGPLARSCGLPAHRLAIRSLLFQRTRKNRPKSRQSPKVLLEWFQRAQTAPLTKSVVLSRCLMSLGRNKNITQSKEWIYGYRPNQRHPWQLSVGSRFRPGGQHPKIYGGDRPESDSRRRPEGRRIIKRPQSRTAGCREGRRGGCTESSPEIRRQDWLDRRRENHRQSRIDRRPEGRSRDRIDRWRENRGQSGIDSRPESRHHDWIARRRKGRERFRASR